MARTDEPIALLQNDSWVCAIHITEVAMAFLPGLLCRSCSRPIALPPAAHPCISPPQPAWPADSAPRNFLCRSCKHVYEYSAQDVRQIALDETDQGQDRNPQNVVCIEIPCSEESCASLIRIHAVMPFDADLHAEMPQVLASSRGHQVRCTRGYLLSKPMRAPATAFSAHIDKEWERLGL